MGKTIMSLRFILLPGGRAPHRPTKKGIGWSKHNAGTVHAVLGRAAGRQSARRPARDPKTQPVAKAQLFFQQGGLPVPGEGT